MAKKTWRGRGEKKVNCIPIGEKVLKIAFTPNVFQKDGKHLTNRAKINANNFFQKM